MWAIAAAKQAQKSPRVNHRYLSFAAIFQQTDLFAGVSHFLVLLKAALSK